MLSVRCKQCNTELTSSSKTQVCGCPNMMTITDDAVSATDLNMVVITRTSPHLMFMQLFLGPRLISSGVSYT